VMKLLCRREFASKSEDEFVLSDGSIRFCLMAQSLMMKFLVESCTINAPLNNI
jgi:hypothetical protein